MARSKAAADSPVGVEFVPADDDRRPNLLFLSHLPGYFTELHRLDGLTAKAEPHLVEIEGTPAPGDRNGFTLTYFALEKGGVYRWSNCKPLATDEPPVFAGEPVGGYDAVRRECHRFSRWLY